MKLLILALMVCLQLVTAQPFSGTVLDVQSGDTFTIDVTHSSDERVGIGRAKIRLWLIAAPRMNQRGGKAARGALLEMIPHGSEVECVRRGQMSGHIVANCVGGEYDLDMQMVKRGNAIVPESNPVTRALRAIIPNRQRPERRLRMEELKLLVKIAAKREEGEK